MSDIALGAWDLPRNRLVAPAPIPPKTDLSIVRLIHALRTNTLAAWPERAYEGMLLHRRCLGTDCYLVNDPEAAREVLTAKQARYERPMSFRRLISPVVGRGLLLAEGEEWRAQRRLLAPGFTPRHVDRLMPRFHEAAGAMVDSLPAKGRTNLFALFECVTIDILGRAIFSVSLTPHLARIVSLRRKYLTLAARPSLIDYFARRDGGLLMSLGLRGRLGRDASGLIADIIAARRANPRTSGDPDILDMILEARDPESGTPLSAKAIRDQVGTMLATGFETTACTIFWAAFLLARDRAELIAVREEIARHPPHSIASFEDFRHWPSLQRALNETLRLYPPIPVLLRVAVADDEIIGARIKPGDLVSVSPWVMHRHRRLWNAPEMFMPERFAQPERSYPPAYIPFGVGPRTCIGAAFAVTEAMLVLGHLLHRFDVTLDDDRPMSAKSVVATMPSVEPLFCLQRDRQDGQ